MPAPAGLEYLSGDGTHWQDVTTTLGASNVLFLKGLVTNVLPGDANQDGQVDVNDLTIVLSNFGRGGMTWSGGDFNGDSRVDINDLTILLSNFGQSAGAAAPMSAVPEPCAAGLAIAGAACLLGLGVCRRRPRR